MSAQFRQLDRMYRHGVLEFFWPRLQSRLDAEAALQRGMWVAFVAGALNVWVYDNSPIVAGTLLALMVVSGVRVRLGSIFIAAGLSAFLLILAIWHSTSWSGLTVPAFLWSITAICLVGALRAAWAASHGSYSRSGREPVHNERSWANVLFVVLGIASVASIFPRPIFGLMFTRAEVPSNSWMEPSLYAHEKVISIRIDRSGAPHHGSVVTFAQPYGSVYMARVAGMPGDRIEVRSGTLIRNGQVVPEPYCQIPYTSKVGDFPPLQRPASPDLLYELQQKRYGSILTQRKPFIVPEATYFVLNDNRNEIFDSRLLGPISRQMIIGRVILAYNADHGNWPHIRLVH
jgi:signal peptidase I